MADQLNNISIQITDGVAPTIQPKIEGIATSSRNAASAVTSLETSIKAISTQSASFNFLKQVAASTNLLKNATDQMGNAASVAAVKNTRLAQSYAAIGYAIKQTLATMQQYVAQAGAAAGATSGFTASQAGLKSGLGSNMSQIGAVNSSLKTLEGSSMGASMAAARLLTSFAPLRGLIAAAFPVIGAIALVEVLGQVYTGVMKIVAAYKDMQVGAREAEDAALRAGDKILKVKPAGGINAADIAAFAQGIFLPKNNNLEIKNVGTAIQDLQNQRELAQAQARVNEAGLQGEALAKQRTKDLQQEQILVGQLKTKADELRESYLKVKEQTTTVDTTSSYNLAKTGIHSSVTVHTITDDKQIAALTQGAQQAQSEVNRLDQEFKVLGLDIQAASKKEPLAALKDNLKAAREELKRFEDQFAKLKSGTQVVTPQMTLDFWKNAQATTRFPTINGQPNTPLDAKVGQAQQEVNRQTEFVGSISTKLTDQVSSIGLYDTALKEQNEIEKLNAEIKKQHIVVDQQTLDTWKEQIKTIAESNDYQKELNKIYEESNGPLDKYQAGLKAIEKLTQDHAITQAQAIGANQRLTQEYNYAVDPLAEITDKLNEQTTTYGKYGIALQIATEQERTDFELRKRFPQITQQQIDTINAKIAAMTQEKALEADLNTIYNRNAGALEKLAIQYAAVAAAEKNYNDAKANGTLGTTSLPTLSPDQANAEKAKIATQQSEVKLNSGIGGGKDVLTSTLGSYLKDFQGLAAGIQATFQKAFATIADGAANAFARAIVYGEHLGTALKNVARQALAEIISGFIKLAIQAAITELIVKKLHINLPQQQDAKETAKTTAVAITSIAAVTAAQLVAFKLLEPTAWSLAEAVSLISFGANAVAANAGISSVVATGQAAAKLANGGPIPGSGNTDSVHIMAMPGEYVVNKKSVAANYDLVVALNNAKGPLVSSTHKFAAGGIVGSTVVNSISQSTLQSMNNPRSVASDSGSTNINMNIIHDGSTNVEAEQIGPNEIRIIAQRAVEEHADRVVGAAIVNPNSKTSKSMHRTLVVQRAR